MLFALLELRNLALELLYLGLLVPCREYGFQGGFARLQLLQLIFAGTARGLGIGFDAFELSAGLHRLQQSAGLSDVVVQQLGVVLEKVVLAEVQVLIEVGFEVFAV